MFADLFNDLLALRKETPTGRGEQQLRGRQLLVDLQTVLGGAPVDLQHVASKKNQGDRLSRQLPGPILTNSKPYRLDLDLSRAGLQPHA